MGSRPPDEEVDFWRRRCPSFEGILALTDGQLDEYSREAAYFASLLEQAFARARGTAWRGWVAEACEHGA
eukprot:2136622-Pyramimonas_sp.AAC.1